MLTINGGAAPSPGTFRVSLEDPAAAAERSASGKLVKDFAPSRRRLRLKWPRLNPAELSALLAAVEGGFFLAGFPDPVTGATAEVRCCCASRSMGVLRVGEDGPIWTDIEMEWMEG